MFKIMVGTLYSGEGDYDRCVASVQSQTYPSQQVIISGMDESTGYQTLYKRFKEGDYDYLLKLDADMVLKDENVIQFLIDKMQQLPHLYAITHMVQDYYQLVPINGIHFYSQRTKWRFENFKPLMLKNIDSQTNFAKMKREERRKVYATFDDVLASHCFWAGPKQSFRYGYHRFLKSNHRDTCCRTFDNYLIHKDENRRLACMGMWAASNEPSDKAGNYGQSFDDLFNKYCNKPFPERKLRKRIKALNDKYSVLKDWRQNG